MAADFPATKKTFTQLVDGTDYTEAAQVNQAYDETEALETFVGAMGRSQSYNTSLKALLSNYRRGCSCVYKSATEITVEAGEVYIPDASGNGAIRQNTSATTVGWGNLDTGSEATDKVYYVFAVADSAATTFTVVVSQSSTAPTGLTYFKLIGTFYNDGSGDIQETTNIGHYCGLGNWVAKATDTVYLAITDGFVSCLRSGGVGTTYSILTDESNPPTTVRKKDVNVDAGSEVSGLCPVKKGHYWKVLNATTVFWIPNGS